MTCIFPLTESNQAEIRRIVNEYLDDLVERAFIPPRFEIETDVERGTVTVIFYARHE